jgi:adenosylcobinamide-GDP ribazoletransferase
MAPLILALRFLTIVPMPGPEAEGPGALGRAAVWFPLIGLALGGALALADAGLRRLFPPLLSAGLVLALWKTLTGGLHLDGLADCLDGLAGRDHEHRRAIMKDSGIGAFGAIGLILVLLLGSAALGEMPGGMRWRVLLVALPLGRTAPLLVGWVFRARTVPGGLGAQFALGASSPVVAGWEMAMLALAAVLLWPGGVLVWLLAPVAVLGWSAFLVRRLGGLSGDVLGAGVEIGELACLLTASALIRLGLP